MLEILPESHDNSLAVRGSLKLTEKDYEEVLIPRLDALMSEHPKARLAFFMDDDFKGWNLEAAWRYARFGFEHRRRFEKVATVCGPKWVRWGMKVKSYFVPGEVRSFPCSEAPRAREWIES